MAVKQPKTALVFSYSFKYLKYSNKATQKSINLFFRKKETNIGELKPLLNNFKHFYKLIEKSVNIFGLKKTIFIYKLIKNI